MFDCWILNRQQQQHRREEVAAVRHAVDHQQQPHRPEQPAVSENRGDVGEVRQQREADARVLVAVPVELQLGQQLVHLGHRGDRGIHGHPPQQPGAAHVLERGGEAGPELLGPVRVEQRDAVTLVTLNRPQALNALNNQVLSELIEVFAAYDTDPSQRCLVLTGSEKAFAAGAELGHIGFPDRDRARRVEALNDQRALVGNVVAEEGRAERGFEYGIQRALERLKLILLLASGIWGMSARTFNRALTLPLEDVNVQVHLYDAETLQELDTFAIPEAHDPGPGIRERREQPVGARQI